MQSASCRSRSDNLTELPDGIAPSRSRRAKAQAHTLINDPHWRIRKDVVDVRGHVSLRYLGKMRHLNVGWAYRGQPIHLYVLDDVVTFATEDGEFIGETRLDPNRDYQPKGDGFKR